MNWGLWITMCTCRSGRYWALMLWWKSRIYHITCDHESPYQSIL